MRDQLLSVLTLRCIFVVVGVWTARYIQEAVAVRTGVAPWYLQSSRRTARAKAWSAPTAATVLRDDRHSSLLRYHSSPGAVRSRASVGVAGAGLCMWAVCAGVTPPPPSRRGDFQRVDRTTRAVAARTLSTLRFSAERLGSAGAAKPWW